MQTNCGDFAFTLDVKDSPNTTSSFAGLVKKGFFDGLTFHRIVPGFVIQGGDPTGAAAEGRASTVDKPPRDAAYTAGVVAMAKTRNEAAGTSGSQFFVVTAPERRAAARLRAARQGDQGHGRGEAIGKLGDPADPTGTGAAMQAVVMKKVTVSP